MASGSSRAKLALAWGCSGRHWWRGGALRCCTALRTWQGGPGSPCRVAVWGRAFALFLPAVIGGWPATALVLAVKAMLLAVLVIGAAGIAAAALPGAGVLTTGLAVPTGILPEHAAGRTDGRSVVLIDLRGHLRTGITVGTRRTMRNHATTEVCFDDLAVPATELDRGRGQGVPPDPDGDGFGDAS